MQCKTCGALVDGKETTCPKCGDPLTTNTTIQATAFDINELKKQPDIIAAGFALIFCFLPWVKMKAFVATVSFSSMNLSSPFMTADTIFAPALLLFLPVCLLLIIVSAFVPKLRSYKRTLLLVSLGLVIYTAIGLYQLTNPAAPDPATLNTSSQGLNNILNMAQGYAQEAIQSAYSVGIGFYLTFVAILVCLFSARIFRKKTA